MDYFSYLRGEAKTSAEIVKFLKDEAEFRRFDQVLRQSYEGEDLEAKLIDGLTKIGKKSRDSVTRKVQNWMKGENSPQNRETVFQICFVLGFDEKKSSVLLATALDTGIHYRNPKELVYAYGLRMGLEYEETVALREKIEAMYPSAVKTDTLQGKEKLYTKRLRDIFSHVSNEQELMDFFQEYGDQLRALHETAYEKFTELLKLLQEPENFNGEKEPKYAMKEVVETYLRMKVPVARRTADYTLLQRMVKKHWPDESSMGKMLKRDIDVSRKALILLYLATEFFDDPEDENLYFLGEEEKDADIVFETRLQSMQLFLNRYGMNELDPGSPFDFLVIYAMRTEKEEKISDRMTAVLESLFE